MAPADHSDYRVEILCPDLSSQLRLERGTAQERLGMLFEIDLSLYSDDKEIDLLALLGKPMAVHLTSATEERYFHGIVSHFAHVGSSERWAHYHAVLQPKLWLLGQAQSCKVFRDQSVQDILKRVLGDGGVDLGGVSGEPAVDFEHCVQYRETDLYFASRLLERYGMYYFHKHEQGRHVLEVVSGMSGHSEVGTFDYATADAAADQQHVFDWRARTALRSGSYRVSGTKNLTRQSIDAKETSRFSVAAAPALKIDDFEAVNEYPKPHLEELAKARMQAIDATVEEFTASTHSMKLGTGDLFELQGHPRADQNGKYLVVAATHHFDGDLPDGTPAGDTPYVVAFTAIDADTPYSPPVHTRKPVVQGPHLATVTEETDEYGRVLVQFHWGSPDDQIESCRARVSQNWAGKEWGGVFLPHTGHEVIVEFLDGDPDQPIVTGRVYNEESMPPLSLPGDKQKCMIRDHGGNELMMDGTDGSQKIRLYCPKHETELVMGNSWSFKTLSDWVNDVGGNASEAIDGTFVQDIIGDVKKTLGANKDESIIGKCNVKVGADVAEMFMGAQHKTIIGLTSTFIGGVKKETIKGAEIKKIGGIKYEKLDGYKITKGKSESAEDFPDAIRKIKATYKQKAKDLVQEVKTSIQAKCDQYKIGAKMLAQDVEDLAVKAKNEVVHQAKTVKLMAKTAWEVESKKAKHDIAAFALSAKLTVNDGNFEVKK